MHGEAIRPHLYAQHQATQSLPHSENECQPSINDFWLCIVGYLTGDWLQTSMNKVLTGFSFKNNSGTLPAVTGVLNPDIQYNIY